MSRGMLVVVLLYVMTTCISVVCMSESGVKINKNKFVGQIGGTIGAMCTIDSIVYIGEGMTLRVLQLSRKNKIRILKTSLRCGDFITDIQTRGNFAFVCAGISGLYVIDIKNKKKPKLLIHYDGLISAKSAAIYGDYLLVADGLAGVAVLEITNTGNLKEVSRLMPGNALDLSIFGKYVCVVLGTGGLKIIDLENITSPKIIGHLMTGGYANRVDLMDGRFVIADGWDGVKLIDIRKPHSPKVVGKTKTIGWCLDVAVKDNLLLAAAGYEGVVLYECVKAKTLKLVGRRKSDSYVSRIEVGNYKNIAYAIDYKVGFSVLDYSNLKKTKKFDEYKSAVNALFVDVKDGKAFVACGIQGFAVFDVANSARIKKIYDFDKPGWATVVRAERGYSRLCRL